ncbi:hypothetical protein A9K71_03085 [Mesorhizobium sp. WSM3873]|nr:hypothetical protein A9K71_03085 [Mesorhizobium sp. WSM3873]
MTAAAYMKVLMKKAVLDPPAVLVIRPDGCPANLISQTAGQAVADAGKSPKEFRIFRYSLNLSAFRQFQG